MKRSLVLMLAAVTIMLSGCKTPEYPPPNGVSYGNFLFRISKVTFHATGSGANLVVFENGSRANYEDESIDNAFFLNMMAHYVPTEGTKWEGEYNLSNPEGNIGGIEYAGRYRNPNTWELEKDAFNHTFISGTIKIKHISGDKYLINLDATTSEGLPLSGLFEGTVLISTDE